MRPSACFYYPHKSFRYSAIKYFYKMMSIKQATEADYKSIVNIGLVAVYEAHKDSTTEENLNEYLKNNYSDAAIKEELNDTANTYHIFSYNGIPAGFSKIVLNDAHPGITAQNVTKLDR